jgi:hypothetical protein
VLAAAAACEAPAPAPWALKPRTAVSLEVTTREDLVETGEARRLEISLRGAVADDGTLALEVGRVVLEVRDRQGEMVRAVAPDEGGTAAPALDALRGAAVRVDLDPKGGVVAVNGLDRAVERAKSAPGGQGALLAVLASDAAWTHDLANAGMCTLPASLRPGAPVVRSARAFVAGRDPAPVRLEGEAARDDRRTPAVHLTGRLADGAACTATTSYAGEGPLPLRGEWTLTTPLAAGLTARRTTSFTLVLR